MNPLALGFYFVSGLIAGTLYFLGLRWNVSLFAASGRTALIVAVMIGRFALLGILLTAAARQGALPLLTMVLGVILGRFAVVRGPRGAAP